MTPIKTRVTAADEPCPRLVAAGCSSRLRNCGSGTAAAPTQGCRRGRSATQWRQINDNRLFFCGSSDTTNPRALAALPKVRGLVLAGQHVAAEFRLATLMQAPKSGFMVTNPGIPPENSRPQGAGWPRRPTATS